MADSKKSPRTQRRFTLSEKLAIVRESMAPGITASHVARRHGVALNLMNTISYGEKDPVASNKTRAGRAQNRRVVLVVMA